MLFENYHTKLIYTTVEQLNRREENEKKRNGH